MYFILVLYFFFDIITHRTFAVSLPEQTNSSSTISYNSSSFESFLRTTIGLSDIPGLSLVVRHSPRPLNVTSCYLSAVQVVKTLTLEDYDGDMDIRRFSFSAYPGVRVTLAPSEFGRRLKRSYALYGIVRSIDYMIQYNFYNDLFIELEFEFSRVGFIYWVSTERHSLTATESKINLSQSLETTDHVLLNLNGTSNLVTANNDVDLGDPLNTRFKVFLNYFGGPLPPPAIIVGVLVIMAGAGEHSRTEHLDDEISIRLTLWDVRVVVDRFAGQPWTTPPFFDYEWLIKAMAKIPVFMYNQRTFNEVRMVIELDGLPIGKVEIQNSLNGKQIASTSRREQINVEK